MRLLLLLLGVAGLVSLASASNLRRMGNRQAHAAIAGLAIKYDCHNQEDNLDATLRAITERNAVATTKLAEERAKLNGEIETTYTDAVKASGAEVDRVTTAADATLAAARTKTESEYTAAVDGLSKATDVAEKDLEAKKLLKTNADAALSTATVGYDVAVGVYADALKAAEKAYTDAVLDSATELKSAQDAAASARTKAKEMSTAAFTSSTGLCTSAFTQGSSILDEDEKTVAEITGLVAKLNLCQAADSATTGTAATAFLEKGEVTCEQLRKEVDHLTQGIGESLGSSEVSFLQLDPAVPTGTVDDLSRRVKDARAKDAAVKAACDQRATTARSTQEDHDDTLKAGSLAKASGAHETNVAIALKLRTKETTEANKPRQAADDAKKQAEAAAAIASTAHNIAEGAFQAAKEAGKKGTADAEQVRTSATKGASDVRKTAVEAAQAEKKKLDGAAKVAETAGLAEVKKTCDAQLRTLTDEVSLVQSIRTKMSAVKLVGTDEADAKKAREKAIADEAAAKVKADAAAKAIADEAAAKVKADAAAKAIADEAAAKAKADSDAKAKAVADAAAKAIADEAAKVKPTQEYYKGPAKSFCRAGEEVTSQAECQAASDAAGLTEAMSVGTWPATAGVPKGCWQFTGNLKYSFNTNPSGGWAYNAHVTPVCKR